MKACSIYTILMVWLTATATAQCKLHKKTDEFSQASIEWTDKVKITSGGTNILFKKYGDNCRYKIYVYLRLQNGKAYICLSEDSDECVCSASYVGFKFNDGKVLQKANGKDGETAKTTLGEERFTFFEITKEELQLLAASTIVKFKTKQPNCSDHPVLQEEMEEAIARQIQTDAVCILHDMP